MSKLKTTLPMKGIRTPRLLIWLRGFLHGKVIHTGGLDPKTNTSSSGYIVGQTQRFHNACIIRRKQAEAKLIKVWAEADQLLIDFSEVSSALANSNRESNAQIRANEKAASRRTAILKNLANILNDIRAEVDSAHDQMQATSEILLSIFSCYGHGLLMKPIYSHNLPELAYEDCANRILSSHEDTWNSIVSILKEVKE